MSRGVIHQTLGTVHQESPIQLASVQTTVVEPDCPTELTTELAMAQQTNRSLQTMALVSLGLGLGVGGMLGIVFMQIIGYINQGRIKQ